MARPVPVHTERTDIDAILKRHFGFARITGLGERKLAAYGDQILAVIRASE